MHPIASIHDNICKLYDGVFWVRGSAQLMPLMQINRNMIIVSIENELTLINPVRLDSHGLSQLDALGRVVRVIRLGDFHGIDDAFYVDRYQCEFWAQAGQSTYKTPQITDLIETETPSPLPNSEFFIFESARYPEAALLLKAHHLLITTDSVQYYSDQHLFSFLARKTFSLVFKQGMNIGPFLLKRVTPKGRSLHGDFQRILQLDFDALIAAHGNLKRSGAKQAVREVVEKIFKTVSTID